MKQEIMRRDGQAVIFCAEDSTVGYTVLFVVLVALAGGVLWWWPHRVSELFTPWARDQWSHAEVWAVAVFTALIGAMMVIFGGYISDRGRRHCLRFDPAHRLTTVEEWWRGFRIELDIPFSYFESFQVHQPIGQVRTSLAGPDFGSTNTWWELGVVLRNNAYWRLQRSADRDDLQKKARVLNQEMAFSETGGEATLSEPERIDAVCDAGSWTYQWSNRERLATQIGLAVAAVVFSLALWLPVVLIFEGHWAGLWATLGLGTVLFAIPLFMGSKSRAVWPFVIGWMAAVAGAVIWVGANWIYFPLATAGAAIFSKSAIDLGRGLWQPERHSLRVDEDGRLFDDEQVLLDDGEPVRCEHLEGALVNITEMRPAQLQLVWPGGGRESRDRHLARDVSEIAQAKEALELRLVGLSLFELIWVSLTLDERIRGDEVEA